MKGDGVALQFDRQTWDRIMKTRKNIREELEAFKIALIQVVTAVLQVHTNIPK